MLIVVGLAQPILLPDLGSYGIELLLGELELADDRLKESAMTRF